MRANRGHFLPSAENFYDLFCGGCSVVHRALIVGRWRNYYANDIDEQVPRLFFDAINGKYKDEKRWGSREDFYRLKDTDCYVSLCWSFGNNRKSYLYSKEIEPWKKALHYARVLGDYSLLEQMGIQDEDEKLLADNRSATAIKIKAKKDEYKEKYIKWWLLQQEYTMEELDELIAKCKGEIKKSEEQLRNYLLEALKKSGLSQADVGKRLGTQMCGHYFGKSQWAFPTEEYYKKMQEFMPLDKDYNEVVGLHNLWESLESLENLESLQNLEISGKSYEQVEIKPDSVIYCDIPYENTVEYISGSFDHKTFYDWAYEQKSPVFISSYGISDKRFVEIFSIDKIALFNSLTATRTVQQEKIYVADYNYDKYKPKEDRQIDFFDLL